MTVLVKALNDLMVFFEFTHVTDELSHHYSNIYPFQLSLSYVMKTYQHLYLKVLTAFNLMSIFSIVHTQNQLRAKI